MILGCRFILCMLLLPCLAAAEPLKATRFMVQGVAVSSRDGTPVPYCRLSAVADATGPTGQPVQTTADASGRFRLEVPRAGSWRVSAAARGFRSQNYDEHVGFFSSVVLSDAVPVLSITFRIAPDSAIRGIVFDEVGEPVANARLSVERIPPQLQRLSPSSVPPRAVPAGTTMTDDLGRYEVSGLAPGEYHVRVQARPWYSPSAGGIMSFRGSISPSSPATDAVDPLDVVYPMTWFPGTDNEERADTLTLAGGEDRQADFHLIAVPAIHLRIPRTVLPDNAGSSPFENARRQQPRPPMITSLTPDGNISQIGTTTTVRGNDWDFGGLAPGTYEIRTMGPDGGPEGEIRQIQVRPGSQPVITMDVATSSTPVTIAFDGEADVKVSQVEFVDTATGRRIMAASPQRDRRGRGQGGRNDAAPDDKPELWSATLLMHSYEVYLYGQSAYLTGIAASGATAAGRIVEIGDHPAALTLHVASGRGDVTGIAQLNGKPAAGALVLLVPATLREPGNLRSTVRDQTNTDGSFALRSVIPGKYILVAIERGWSLDWRRPETLARFLLKGVPVELEASGKLKVDLTALLP